MNTATISPGEDESRCFELKGSLDFTTVPSLLSDSEALFKGLSDLVVDLSGVASSNGAGLALLLEWLRLARARQQRIAFQHVPESIMVVAKASEVDQLIPLAAP